MIRRHVEDHVEYIYDSSHLSCSAALCSDSVAIDNGVVTFAGTSVGDTATYSCDPGFELIGNATTTCTLVDTNSAQFTPAQPFCRREHCVNINGVSTWLLVFTEIRGSQKKNIQKFVN